MTAEYSYLIPDVMDDCEVAFQCGEKNSVCRGHQKTPQRKSCEPDTTNELIVDAVGRHASAVHLDNRAQQGEQ